MGSEAFPPVPGYISIYIFFSCEGDHGYLFSLYPLMDQHVGCKYVDINYENYFSGGRQCFRLRWLWRF